MSALAFARVTPCLFDDAMSHGALIFPKGDNLIFALENARIFAKALPYTIAPTVYRVASLRHCTTIHSTLPICNESADPGLLAFAPPVLRIAPKRRTGGQAPAGNVPRRSGCARRLGHGSRFVSPNERERGPVCERKQPVN
jgi:hypothetical protein